MKYVIDCVSDTHGTHKSLVFKKPKLDTEDQWILVHAGDFSYYGKQAEVDAFLGWTLECPHDHIVFTAGNHELHTDQTWISGMQDYYASVLAHPNTEDDVRERVHKELASIKFVDLHAAVSEFDRVHYLCNSGADVAGLRLWGSPYSLRFYDWAYQLDHIKSDYYWSQIPDDVQVLITHGPAYGKGDRCPDIEDPMRMRMINVGDRGLLEAVRARNPLMHVYGHIHPGFGCYEDAECTTTFVNAASVLETYKPRGKYIRITIENGVVTERQVMRC